MNHVEKIFISHAHKEKLIAGGLKASLESIGYQAFVAHDDILPSKEWKDEIIKALNECRVFIVIVSLNSDISQWVHQEIGYARAKNMFIIPIKIDSTDPKGMISDIQAFPMRVAEDQSYNDNKDAYDSCARIVRSLITAEKRGTNPSSTDLLINELISSPSYAQSTTYIKKLDRVSVFSEEQVDKLLDAALMNDQVSGNYDANNFYKRLLSKNRHYRDEDKILKIRKLFND